jgi:hypothetical protein
MRPEPRADDEQDDPAGKADNEGIVPLQPGGEIGRPAVEAAEAVSGGGPG